jgi:hypothetical protein
MNFVLKTVVAATFIGLASPVYAVELTNSDQNDQTIIVMEDGKEKSYTIAAGETLKDICLNACVVKLADGQEFTFEGHEYAYLEDGYVYVDEADTQYTADDGSSEEMTSEEGETTQEGDEESSEEAPQEDSSEDAPQDQ